MWTSALREVRLALGCLALEPLTRCHRDDDLTIKLQQFIVERDECGAELGGDSDVVCICSAQGVPRGKTSCPAGERTIGDAKARFGEMLDAECCHVALSMILSDS